jgi:hypothetical protein
LHTKDCNRLCGTEAKQLTVREILAHMKLQVDWFPQADDAIEAFAASRALAIKLFRLI